MKWFTGLVVLVVASALWVRFWPVDPNDWHVDTTVLDDPGSRGFALTFTTELSPQAALETLSAAALKTPRTRVLAGDPESGRITVETRTRLWGFPDYSTIDVKILDEVSVVTLYGRSGFGGYDWNTNKSRIRHWTEQFEAIQK